MEQKFKVGDEVYDQVNYPNQKGKIDIIESNNLGVNYENDFVWYSINGEKNGLKVLSHTPYTIEFKNFTQERPKVLTEDMKVCIKGDGTAEYGKKIIEHLESLGGVNEFGRSGSSDVYNIYAIDKNFNIDNSKAIPQGYKEISLKEVEQELKVEPIQENVVKTIYNMNLHETITISKDFLCTRVAGGWIYEIQKPIVNVLETIFVPFSNEFM